MEKMFSSRIQIILSVITLLNLIFGAIVSTQLAPVALDLAKVKGEVDALQNFQDENKPLIERFYQLEQRDKQLVETVNDIDKKVDVILEQHIQLRNELKK